MQVDAFPKPTYSTLKQNVTDGQNLSEMSGFASEGALSARGVRRDRALTPEAGEPPLDGGDSLPSEVATSTSSADCAANDCDALKRFRIPGSTSTSQSLPLSLFWNARYGEGGDMEDKRNVNQRLLSKAHPTDIKRWSRRGSQHPKVGLGIWQGRAETFTERISFLSCSLVSNSCCPMSPFHPRVRRALSDLMTLMPSSKVTIAYMAPTGAAPPHAFTPDTEGMRTFRFSLSHQIQISRWHPMVSIAFQPGGKTESLGYTA